MWDTCGSHRLVSVNANELEYPTHVPVAYLFFKTFRQNQELTDKRCKVLQSVEILKF